jgi:hypothetical protein
MHPVGRRIGDNRHDLSDFLVAQFATPFICFSLRTSKHREVIITAWVSAAFKELLSLFRPFQPSERHDFPC